ncbi:MAG: hypothetical protein IPK69_01240 [Phycisphaerales bacterium]|nr:MAG: hypothetical protein IPK69_01240 [Phycisphaerales bacterium]
MPDSKTTRSRTLVGLVAALVLAVLAPLTRAQSEVTVTIDQLGVGKRARIGDWCGVRVRMRDAASKPRDVVVRLSGPDADGDHPEYERVVALNPNSDIPVWLYMRLPFASSNDWIVSVLEAEEDRASPIGFRGGRLLGRVNLFSTTGTQGAAGSPIPSTAGLIGVLGPGHFGLADYRDQMQGGGPGVSTFAQEVNEVVSGMSVDDLPDRWQGLSVFDVIVWGRGEPGALRGERAKAMREWITRGGHLVIVLPSVGQTWSNPSTNELYDLMPAVTIGRREDVDLEPLRDIFYRERPEARGRTDRDTSKDPKIVMPNKSVVQTLTPIQGAPMAEAWPVAATPDGEPVIVRRLVGLGAVTVVGFDLNAPAFVSGRAIQVERFWNRILGKRGQPIEGQSPGVFGRSQLVLDEDLGRWVSASGRTGSGLLLAIVLFGVYWLLAGPMAYIMLKRRSLHHHAWLAFFGLAGVFTLLAWTGATALRPKTPLIRHATFLDHVYGQPVDRARTWFGVMLPGYGRTQVSLGDERPGGDGGMSSDILAPWEAPSTSMGMTFTDSAAYVVDALRPRAMSVPTRGTMKEFVADWSGPPVWSMFQPVNVDGSVGSLEWGKDDRGRTIVKGKLIHKLPGLLQPAMVIVVRGQRDYPTSVEMWANGSAYSVSEWPADEVVDLELKFKESGGASTNDLSAWLDTLTGKLGASSGMMISSTAGGDEWDRLLALSVEPMLDPPDLRSTTSQPSAALVRRATHGYDIARWFTQPCVIVIGLLEDRDLTPADKAVLPTPVRVDGEAVRSAGVTLVRWMYPMPGTLPDFRDMGTSSQPGETTTP